MRLKTLLLSLLIFCMVCPAISYAGTNKVLDLVLSGDFASADPWDVTATEWSISAGVANWVSDGTDTTMSQDTILLVQGNTYAVYMDVSNTSLTGAATVNIQIGGGTVYPVNKDQVFNAANPLYLECGASVSSGLEITAVGGTAADTMTFDNISVIVEQFKPSTTLTSLFITNTRTVNAGADIGPIDEYIANGTVNGQIRYTSVNTHPDGTGGAPETWDLWWDDIDTWIISLAAGTKGSNHWKLTATSPVGSFTAVGDVTGAAKVTFGPVDHTTSTGSPAILTDGDTGFGDLNTAFNMLNDLAISGKFGIVSVFNNYANNTDNSRLISSETSNNISYRLSSRTAPDLTNTFWSGTNPISEVSPTVDGVIRNNLLVGELAVSEDVWIFEQGILVDSDTTVNGLDAAISTLLRLGATAYNGTNLAKAKYGFTSIQNYTNVTTVDASWSTGLSQAINTAALSSNYNPHSIAAGITAYINGIDANAADFVYYPLDEANSGDMSSYYLLAYDEDGVPFTSEFYGLTSPSGVTGTELVPGGGRYQTGYRSTYRSRYNGGGR